MAWLTSDGKPSQPHLRDSGEAHGGAFDSFLLPVRTQGLVHPAWGFDTMRKHPQPHLFRTLQSRLRGLQHEGVLFIPEAPHLGGAQVVTGTGALRENAGAFR